MGLNGKADEPRLVEVTSIPVIYVDDFAKIIVEGGNVRITFIEIRTFGSERVKMPVLEIVRPLASCDPDRFLRMIREAAGEPEMAEMRH